MSIVPQSAPLRTCVSCGAEKPLTLFAKNTRRPSDPYHHYCKECHNAWNREYKRKNRERLYQYNREWSKAHPRDSDYIAPYCAAANATARARKLGNQGRFTAREWKALCEHYGNRCLCCGRTPPEITLSVDHVVPLSRGGANTIDNLQPLCRSCNSHKRKKIIDYRQKVGQL